MSEASIEMKWNADSSRVVLSPKMVRFAHPVVTSLRYTPRIRREEYKRCFFTKDELDILEEDRESRIFEEQFETRIQRGTEVQITFPVRRVNT
jgi:hypothetical protein